MKEAAEQLRIPESSMTVLRRFTVPAELLSIANSTHPACDLHKRTVALRKHDRRHTERQIRC